MAVTSRERIGELVRIVFAILSQHPEGMHAQELFSRVEELTTLSEFEKSEDPHRPGVRRFERIISFATMAPLKAGWFVKDNGRWILTDDGKKALEAYKDPETFSQKAAELGLDAVVQDEILRSQIREQIEELKPDKPDSIFRHPLAPVIVGFLLTGILGLGITTWISGRQKEQELAEKQRDALTIGLTGFSEQISERRVRAVLLESALKRASLLAEVKERKRDYDEAYATWERKLRANMFVLRQGTGFATYSEPESEVQYYLTPLFTIIDSCLTTAYDERTLRSKNPEPQLDECLKGGGTETALKAVLNCSSAITDRIYASLHNASCTTGDCNLERCKFPVPQVPQEIH